MSPHLPEILLRDRLVLTDGKRLIWNRTAVVQSAPERIFSNIEAKPAVIRGKEPVVFHFVHDLVQFGFRMDEIDDEIGLV